MNEKAFPTEQAKAQADLESPVNDIGRVKAQINYSNGDN